MQKRYYILLFILFTFPVFAQTSQDYSYKLNYPENIPSNAVFDISLIANNLYNNADKLVLYINTSSRITIKNIELRTFDNVTDVAYQLNYDTNNLQGNTYRASIDLKKNNITTNSYFQMLFKCKADNADKAEFNFSGIFKENGGTAGYIQSPGNINAEDTLRLSKITLKFYKTQRFADNSISIGPGADFSVTPNNKEAGNLLTEFWLRVNNKETGFLKIINHQSGEVLFDISTNPYQMITIKSQNQFNSDLINPYFLSRGSWYHFAVLSSFDEGTLSIYCDKSLVGKYSIPSFLNANDLEWKFINDSQNKTFQLDVLRFINLNNNIELSYLNRNYLNFIGNNSGVLYQFNFDNENELYLARDRISINYQSISFRKSDAPIFARAPELNVNILGNVYELNWSGGDYKQAKSYILERSVNNSDFQLVSSVQADNSYEKKYSLIDAKDPSSEVVYYRVKQINTDGSIVYSSQVKIGQGLTEPFIVEQNYPNPFNPTTSIVVDLLQDSDVQIIIYNLEGKEIAKLFNGFLTSWTHKFSFDASELPSGIYLYKVSTPEFSSTRKMILTK